MQMENGTRRRRTVDVFPFCVRDPRVEGSDGALEPGRAWTWGRREGGGRGEETEEKEREDEKEGEEEGEEHGKA